MSPRPTRKARNALLRKGFFEEEDGDHRRLHHCVDGHTTNVRTHYSHGERECNDYILGRMAKHLRISRAQLDALIDCGMSGEEYVGILRGRGELKPPADRR
jgi:hypothetical protein